LPFFKSLKTALGTLETFDFAVIDATIKATAASNQIKPGEIMQLLRVFISGQSGGVDLLGMMELLGKQEVFHRLEKALEKF
jgi:glutamyl/glutaminyl-tRNA synthetase